MFSVSEYCVCFRALTRTQIIVELRCQTMGTGNDLRKVIIEVTDVKDLLIFGFCRENPSMVRLYVVKLNLCHGYDNS